MTTEEQNRGGSADDPSSGDSRSEFKPAAVRSVPAAEWSLADRTAWARAMAPGVRLRKGGAGAHLAPITQDDLARRYGYFVDHLMRNGVFDPVAPAAGQLTPDRVEGFVEELRSRVGSVTTAQTVHKLRRAAQLLDPNRDFTWLADIEKDLALMVRPQFKDHRIVDPDRLLEAGLALIEEALENPALTPRRRARQVRNGLMVALLTLCPIRLKNFAALELQASFRRVGTRWWVVLDRKDTKSRRPDERRVPEDLDAAIEAYLLVHRPVLAAAKMKGSVGTSGRQDFHEGLPNTAASCADPLANIAGPFWLTSDTGERMTYSAVERVITETTRLALGVAVSPHLFRTSAATAIYTHAGNNPNLASGVLQHIDRRVTEDHYNRATSISAARQYAEIVKRSRVN